VSRNAGMEESRPEAAPTRRVPGSGATLVTGANGFVGAAVVRALLADGYAVRAFVRRGSDRRNLAGLPVEIAEGDLTDRDSLRAALRGSRYALHVAADYRLWAPDPRPMYTANVDGSLNVVECAAESGVARVVYTSSVAVLGIHADRTPADESSPVSLADMVGHYKRSKYLAEEAVRRRAAELHFPVVVVNPSTPIGPGDVKPTPTGRIILDAACGRIPAFVDTGLNLVHVDDVARGHLLALEHGRPGERYVLGGADMTLEAILAMVAKHMGRHAPKIRLPRAGVYPVAVASEIIARFTGKEPRVTLDGLRMAKKHMYFSSAKAERELGYGWRPPEQAIVDSLAWFRRHGYMG
jgi:dihydroflavonol-4-reductase